MTPRNGGIAMRAIVFLLVTLFTSSLAWAGEAEDANIEVLRDTIRANKKALVAVNLILTDEEAKDFWPLYDRYEGEIKTVNDRLLKLIDDYTKNYGKLTDEQAKKLAEDYLAVVEDRAKVRRTYFTDFTKILPGEKGGAVLPDREQDGRGDPLRSRERDSRRRAMTGRGARCGVTRRGALLPLTSFENQADLSRGRERGIADPQLLPVVA